MLKSSNNFTRNYCLCDIGNEVSVLDGYDRELALIILRGQLFESDSCHGDLAKELESCYDDIENDELLCASYFVGKEDEFVLIHEGLDFSMEDLRLLSDRFHSRIYLEGSNNVYEINFNRNLK